MIIKNVYNIEIELILKYDNDYFYMQRNFIDIRSEEEKEYYHIYFNDNKNETKKYVIGDENISKIKIKIGYQIKSFQELFRCCECIG